MKKILFLFVLFMGITSSSDATVLNYTNTVIENYDNNSEDSKIINFEFSIEFIEVCSGTLTYNGVPIATFVGFGESMTDACENARQQARNYVLSLGDEPGF